jgi:Asp-tRNA(Asn)/Glu-tRNA(Gln) amidotransferase A subunit family amidase
VGLLDVPPPSAPRIAVSPRLGLNVAVDPDVMAAFEAAIIRLRAAGWCIEQADVTWPEGTSEGAFGAVIGAASALLFGERQAKDKKLFGDNVTGLQDVAFRPAKEANSHALLDGSDLVPLTAQSFRVEPARVGRGRVQGAGRQPGRERATDPAGR